MLADRRRHEARPVSAFGEGPNVAAPERLCAQPGEAHGGGVFCCTYTPDGAFVLSGGWDGWLRLWDASSAAVITGFQAGPKPLSACAVTPDASRWVSGSM